MDAGKVLRFVSSVLRIMTITLQLAGILRKRRGIATFAVRAADASTSPNVSVFTVLGQSGATPAQPLQPCNQPENKMAWISPAMPRRSNYPCDSCANWAYRTIDSGTLLLCVSPIRIVTAVAWPTDSVWQWRVRIASVGGRVLSR